MCILFIYMSEYSGPEDFRLVLVSNRDEYYYRPSIPADFWPNQKNIIGGMDMQGGREGGTWLAMNTDGRIGVLLNILGKKKPNAAKGRGQLVSAFLTSSCSAKDYVDNVASEWNDYSGFHLLAVNILDSEVYHVTNIGSEDERKPYKMEGKIFSVGNSGLNAPFKKVLYGRSKFQSIINDFGTIKKTDELITNLLGLLKSEERHYPDNEIMRLAPPVMTESLQQPYSAVFVKIPDWQYGTRTHTIILVDYNWKVDFLEWTMEEPVTDFNNAKWVHYHKEFYVNGHSCSKY